MIQMILKDELINIYDFQDHFEINVAPLTICITALFYKKMMTFAFPEKDEASFDDDFDSDKKNKKKNKKSKVLFS